MNFYFNNVKNATILLIVLLIYKTLTYVLS